jgi:NAD(P)-dependent dehydrogenase (short-subunit alcohol dehydrogenase family)
MNGRGAIPATGSVLVTGSSTGLGLETAIYLAGQGLRVYATVRDLATESDVLRAAAERGVSLRMLRLDLTDQTSIGQAVGTVLNETGGILALVNNGGVGLRGCLEDVSIAEVRQVFEANVFGTLAVIRAVLPAMRAAGRGRIVTISSVGGRISSFGVGAYCATKFAQEGLGEALALEVAPFGIQAILIEPGMISTTRWTTNRATAAGAEDPHSPYREMFLAGEEIADRIVARSRTQPIDVARAVYRAITTDRPRMRYVVGRPASVVILLRRYLPDRLFERVYFGPFLHRIQHARTPETEPRQVAAAPERSTVPGGYSGSISAEAQRPSAGGPA